MHLNAIADISKNLRKNRFEQGLSQSHLAALAEVENTTISRLENMEVENPKLATLSKLARALGVTLASLVTTALTLAGHCRIEQHFN